MAPIEPVASSVLTNERLLSALIQAPSAVILLVILLWVIPRFQRENRESRIAFQNENRATRIAFQHENQKDRNAYRQEMALERSAHREETSGILTGVQAVKTEVLGELREQTSEIRELRDVVSKRRVG